MSVALTARNASLQDAVKMLTEQATQKLDMVLPMSAMQMQGGHVQITGVEPIVSESGVTLADGLYRPTEIGDSSVATKLGIPITYMRTLRSEAKHLPLMDENVNHWLRQTPDRKVLARTFRGTDEVGIFRMMGSERYRIMDNLDLTLAILDGLRDADIRIEVTQFDISERGMRFVLDAPDIAVYAPNLLRGYRDPITGNRSDVIHAGIAFANSETGFGAATAVPRFRVLACSNGMSITKDAIRNVHLGGKMDEGIVQWSDDTQAKSLELVRAQVRDAVTTFMDVAYMTRVISEMEEKAGVPISNPEKAIKVIQKRAGFTEVEAQGILSHFIGGGQPTAGGMMQAVTSFAQTIESPERAIEAEEKAMAVLDIAASLAK